MVHGILDGGALASAIRDMLLVYLVEIGLFATQKANTSANTTFLTSSPCLRTHLHP
jgi:hypothetical protein